MKTSKAEIKQVSRLLKIAEEFNIVTIASVAQVQTDEDNDYRPRGILNALDLRNYTVATENEDGSLCCWLCMIEKYLYGKDWISYKTIPAIYSNRHWAEHFLKFHRGINWDKFTPHLDHYTPEWLSKYRDRKLRQQKREEKQRKKELSK